MKARSKALLLALCAVLLVAALVLGTMAYLTSQAKVTNTFSVGQVKITMDEAKADKYGVALTGTEAGRGNANEYILMPGHTYIKDPTVHVDKVSEDSYIFVKVENGISALEAAAVEGGYKTIADQITANGWEALAGVENVYYMEYTKDTTKNSDLKVFESFKIADEANKISGWGNALAETKVTVTAYAVQKDGFDSASAAWSATFGKTATNGEGN